MKRCVPESGGNIIWEKRIGDVVIKVNDKYKKTKTLQDVVDLLNDGIDLGYEFFLPEGANEAFPKIEGVISN